MQKGDISNEVPHRMIVVFDGCVATLPPTEDRGFRLYCRLRRWKEAENLFIYDDLVLAWLKDVTWRHGWRVDVVAFQPQGICEAIADRLDFLGISVPHVMPYPDAKHFGRAMAHLPEVVAVIHGDDQMQMAVGSRGYDIRSLGINGFIAGRSR